MPQLLIQKRSYGSVKVFWLDRDRAIAQLKKSAEKVLSEKSEVISAILFGSMAENRATPGSDADILILLDCSKDRFMDRPRSYQGYFDGIGIPVELFCYTMQEARRIPSAKRAMDTGLILKSRSGAEIKIPDQPE